MKINIDNTTYIFMLISFLSGYFEYVFLFLLIIFIHEFGHFFFYRIISNNECNIIIYPFGGIALFNEKLNIETNKELFILLGGIIFQLIFYLLIYKLYCIDLITIYTYEIIKKINILLISFNFMPILPLDGGRILNIILDRIFSYKLSYKISIYISFVFCIIFLIKNISILRVLLCLFLLKNIYYEYKNINNKYNSFLFERYMYKMKFKKVRIINNINCFKRDNYHIINNEFEENYLFILFDRNI